MDVGAISASATIAFWAFVAIAVIAKTWGPFVTRRETEKTIRAAIEKGQQLDPAVIEQMLRPKQRPGREGLLVGGAVNPGGRPRLPHLGLSDWSCGGPR